MFFVGKRTSYSFPWKKKSLCQNSAYTLARNTPNASKNFGPICLPKPKSFEFLKKSSVWVSVVRVCKYFHSVWKLQRTHIFFQVKSKSKVIILNDSLSGPEAVSSIGICNILHKQYWIHVPTYVFINLLPFLAIIEVCNTCLSR